MKKRIMLAAMLGIMGFFAGFTVNGAEDAAAASVEVIESQGKLPCCPHCGSSGVVRNGSADGLQRYKCRDCQRTFNALTGTPLARLRHKAKWIVQAEALRDGSSITQAAKQLKVARSTAFRWRHRFLALPKTIQAQALMGIAEADETFFLRSCKGQRHLDRKPRRRGGRAAKRGLSKEQVPVLVARDRSGATANIILTADSKTELVAALRPSIRLQPQAHNAFATVPAAMPGHFFSSLLDPA